MKGMYPGKYDNKFQLKEFLVIAGIFLFLCIGIAVTVFGILDLAKF